jgi:hypothetical protein
MNVSGLLMTAIITLLNVLVFACLWQAFFSLVGTNHSAQLLPEKISEGE